MLQTIVSSKQFVIATIFFFTLPFLRAHNGQDKILFEENKKQWKAPIKYRAQLKGANIYLEDNAITYSLYNAEQWMQIHGNRDKKTTIDCHAYKVSFLNASYKSIEKKNPSSSYDNYFIGNDPDKWASNVKSYENITYKDLYPGISLQLYSNNQNIKYDIVVEPGASLDKFQMLYEGPNNIFIKEGELHISTSLNVVVEKKPYTYQVINGIKKEVTCCYTLNKNKVGFQIRGAYNKDYPLIIDPILVFSTYTGSTADNWGFTATYDDAGNAFSGGFASGLGYPTSVGAYQETYGGGLGSYQSDMAIIKYNPTGTNRIFATYLGGSINEQPQSMITDKEGNLYIYGRTYSSNFPITSGAFDTSFNGAYATCDIIVSKLDPTGTVLLASTYVGGNGDDGVNINPTESLYGSLKYNYGDDARGEIVLDNNNNVYITSSTQSADFPTTSGCYQTMLKSSQDACVFKLNSDLNNMLWSTYVGGNSDDAGYALTLDNNNNVYITGGTSSNDFPVTQGVLITSYQGAMDGFISKIKNDGSSLLSSTYIGTSSYDQSFFVQTDANGDIYIYGQTESSSYPVTTGVYSNINGKQFIHKINSTLSSTLLSTVFGAGQLYPDISPSAFLVDVCGKIYISGWGRCAPAFNHPKPGSTTGLTISGDAFQSATDGCDFYFMVLDKNATSLLYATFFGENSSIGDHVDGGTSRFDKRGVIYQSVCASCNSTNGFPVTPGVWSPNNNSTNCNNALIKFDFQQPIIAASASAAPSTAGCAPLSVNFSNSSANALSYEWDFGDGTPVNTSSSVNHMFPIGTYTVVLIAINPNACNDEADTFHLKIISLPLPLADLGKDTTTCLPPDIILNAQNPGFDYVWTTTETTQTIHVTNEGTYWVQINKSGCSSADTIEVDYNPNLISKAKIPNVFTPNSDGINDKFLIDGVNYGSEYELKIFDRWGLLLFETGNPVTSWDGFYKGKPSSQGVYYYLLHYKDECFGAINNDKGFLQLLR